MELGREGSGGVTGEGKTKTVFEEGTFVFACVFAYLKFVLAALGPEGVGAADEQ